MTREDALSKNVLISTRAFQFNVMPSHIEMADQDKLERALERAVADPVSRPEFYRTLLESEIFIIGHSDAVTEIRTLLPSGSKIDLVHWEKKDGTPVVPFFTSLEALRRSLKEEGERPFLHLRLR